MYEPMGRERCEERVVVARSSDLLLLFILVLVSLGPPHVGRWFVIVHGCPGATDPLLPHPTPPGATAHALLRPVNNNNNNTLLPACAGGRAGGKGPAGDKMADAGAQGGNL